MRGVLTLALLLGLCSAAGCVPLEDFHLQDGGVCDGGPCPEPDAGKGCSELNNPQGCTRDADCGPAHHCAFDPLSCRSNSCSCDRRTENWACAPNCAGGTCVPSGAAD